MKLREKLKKAKKEISGKHEVVFDSDDNALITVKLSQEQQAFSAFDFDCNDKLNDELGTYIWDKARFVPPKNDIRIKVYATAPIKDEEVENAIHNHFKKEYLQVKADKHNNLIFSLFMIVVGLLSLGLLFLSYAFFKNPYVDVVIEIVVWVFLWEGVDALFLQRTQLRRKQLTLLKLYCSKIEIVKQKKQKKEIK